MELKDKITVTISIAALIISIGATINSEVKARQERNRTIRSQLTDVLGRMNRLSLEEARLFKEIGTTDPILYQRMSSILSQENGFLLNQSMYLTSQIPEMVSCVEFNTIAVANSNSGDLITAEKYYQKAIDTAPTDYAKSGATRSYATFLFPQRRYEEARQKFQEAIKTLKGGDNLVRYSNGTTYLIWGQYEAAIASSKSIVDDLFKKAENEFSGIDVEMVRVKALEGVAAARKGGLPPNDFIK